MKSVALQVILGQFSVRLALVMSLLMLSFATPVSAQGVLSASQTGVIQDLVGEGPGQLVISGTLYNYSTDVTEFSLRGETVSDGDLELGMVVRFTLRDGILERVEIIGPNNLIQDFDSH